MSTILSVIIGLLCGILSGYGIGGGSLLMVFLTAAMNMEQTNAQSINLIYFLPTAAAAILLHAKNRQIEWRAVLPIALAGCVGATAGSLLAGSIPSPLLQKCFGAFLLIIGARMIFIQKK